MIYCNLKGGFGNMLFQIAATINFAKKNNTSYSFPNLDSHLDYLARESHHNLKLNCTNHYRKFFANLPREKPTKKLKVFKFPFHYVEVGVPNNCVIDGFFQSEKYFSSCREDILSIFNTKESIDKVSIHVRRGDFLRSNNHHNVMGIEYCTKAINFFKGEKFLIFTDDYEWCKKKFADDCYKIYEGENDLDEFHTMAACKHNIIANSSFSWWAAWINTNKEKKVICPQQWVGSNLSHLNTKDIYCKNWIKI
jgi:hypothetical protein